MTEQTPITLTTLVGLRNGQGTWLEEDCDKIVLKHGTKSITFPAYVADHLRILVESTSAVTAKELPSSLDDSGKITLLRRLESGGVIDCVQLEPPLHQESRV
ncbi:hypothetical protein [Streptomyces chartreusis]|uniref:hypothetical protein n=1 Tax=Streptomyces chartreusis TaxID=1969 RepID=UPI0036437E12